MKVRNATTKVANLVPDLSDSSQQEVTDTVQKVAEQEIDDDKELLSKIYDSSIAKNLPKKTFSSERDRTRDLV